MMSETHVERFNRAARDYDTDRCPGRAECARKVLALLDPQAGDVVLDVGCGPGIQLIALSRSIRAGYGVDPAVKMIGRAAEAAASLANLRFLVGEAGALPSEVLRAGVNKIYSSYALHHLADTEKRCVIGSFAALLPPGGLFVYGDLMFSGNPEAHGDLHDFAGYESGCDTPARRTAVEEMFVAANLVPSTFVLNPLVAVVAGRKPSA